MIHTDQQFGQRVEDEVARLEERTDAEVVVVAAERSGGYHDLSFAAASVISLVALVVILLLPHPIAPPWAIVDLVLVWLVAAWLCTGRSVIRLLAPRARKDRHVSDAAAIEFHREAVHATPRRTGLLIYVSALEGRVELIPDVGLEGRIPRGLWTDARTEFAHDDLEHFLKGLRRVGEILAEHVPNTGEAQLELPNAPRVRP